MKTQVVNTIVDPLHVTVSGLQVGSTDPTKYVTVRLTNGTSFYSATGGGGGGSSDSSDFDVEFPAFGVAAGFTNGTNLVSARAFDLDSGAGTQNVLGVNLRLTSNGGSVEFGTVTAPFRTDPTGTTIQPVSDAGGSLTVDGTVSAVQSGGWNITNISGTVSLPTGAATAALQTAGNTDLATLAGTVDGTSVRVEIVGGSSSGTEYTEGDVDATITGTAILWEDAGNTLRVPSAGTPLPVTVVSGGSAGVQYTEGDTDASITGTAIMFEGAANTLIAAPGTATDGLLVNLGGNNDVTVTGTVTANQGGTWNIADVSGTVSLPTGASTAALQTTGNTSLATIAGAVSGTEVQVDVLTLPAVTGTVTANAGTNLNTSALALESGGNLAGAATSLAVIDDWDESDRAKVNLIVGQAGVAAGAGNSSATTQRVVIATDQAVIPVSDNGGSITVDGTVTANAGTGAFTTQFNLGTTARVTSASISASSSGDNTLVAGTGGQTIRVFRIFIVVASAVNIKFKSGSTDLTGLMNMTANGAFVLDFDSEPWFITGDGDNFVLNLSSGVQASGRIYYTKS